METLVKVDHMEYYEYHQQFFLMILMVWAYIKLDSWKFPESINHM